jgi:hypothetical protein
MPSLLLIPGSCFCVNKCGAIFHTKSLQVLFRGRTCADVRRVFIKVPGKRFFLRQWFS